MIKPLVSVIIPCYNAEKFVEQAVRSVMKQTYSNLEIIVLNDCSTDNTGNILRLLTQEDNRIIYIENEYNLKLPNTLNKGISIAKGVYIARMDADDICCPERIEKQISFLINNPNIDIVGGNAQLIDERGQILPNKRTYRLLTHSEIIETLPYKCPFTHPSILAKRSFFSDTGEFKNISYAEDYEYWIRAWYIGKKFANLPDILIYYRIHADQMSKLTYDKSNSLEIKKFLFSYFKKTYNYKFLFGILCHTKFIYLFIKFKHLINLKIDMK